MLFITKSTFFYTVILILILNKYNYETFKHRYSTSRQVHSNAMQTFSLQYNNKSTHTIANKNLKIQNYEYVK